MRFIQYLDGDGNQRVGCTSTDAGRVRRLDGVASTVALAQAAFAHALPMEQMAELRLGALEPAPLARMLESLRVLTPLMHDDPSRCLVTGTGLTHLGSAATRDASARGSASRASMGSRSGGGGMSRGGGGGGRRR